MSNYSHPVLRFSSAVVGLYCAVVSIVPMIAHAGEISNKSNAFSLSKDESQIEGGKGSYNKSGDSSGTDPNRLAKIRAQQMQSQLEEEQYALKNASERVNQVEAQGSTKSTLQPRTSVCLSTDRDLKACAHSTTNKRSELASAKAAKATAASNLAKTKIQMRQLLAALKAKSNLLSSKKISY